MSRQEAMDALIDAVIRLLDEKSAADLSVRDIAAEAGVNHGLVHHYFGSKMELVHAAVKQASSRLNQIRPRHPQMTWSFDYFRQHPELVRIVARVCLDGPHDVLPMAAPPREQQAEAVNLITQRLEQFGLADTFDPTVLNAAGVAALLGWIVFKPLLIEGFGVPAETADEEAARIVRWIDALLAPTVPESGGNGD